jgi:pyruvate dehydrogenase (quinone)
VLEGDPKFEASQDIPDVPYARFAELIGLAGLRVEAPDEIGPAWDAALAADRPFVLDVVTDPEVPPLPPHITFEQARMFAASVAKGDVARSEMIRRSLKDKLAEYLPRR